MLSFNFNRAFRLTMTLVVAGLTSTALGSADEETAKTLTLIFRSARAVVAENIKSMKTNPNEAGLDLETTQKAVNKKYLAATGIKIDTSVESNKNLVDAIDAVFAKALSDGFKETWAHAKYYPNKLLPARFAREIGQKLKETSGGKYEIRLTVVDDCLVNSDNKADDWERKTINEKIGAKGWNRNKGYFEVQADKKQARYILPEYYEASCLACHGAASGRELHPKCPNTELGAFGGAISVIMKM